MPLPFKLPGTVGAFIVAGSMYGILVLTGQVEVAGSGFDPSQGLLPYEWWEALQCKWMARMQDTFNYLPLIIPFALATVVGGIDCTESAIAAGDQYDTKTVIGVEALATLVASFCGAVIQTTPYIGHPAYKAMGGRAAVHAGHGSVHGLYGACGTVWLLLPIHSSRRGVSDPRIRGLGDNGSEFHGHAAAPLHGGGDRLCPCPGIAGSELFRSDLVFHSRSGQLARVCCQPCFGREGESRNDPQSWLYLDQYFLGIGAGDGHRSQAGPVGHLLLACGCLHPVWLDAFAATQFTYTLAYSHSRRLPRTRPACRVASTDV